MLSKAVQQGRTSIYLEPNLEAIDERSIYITIFNAINIFIFLIYIFCLNIHGASRDR